MENETETDIDEAAPETGTHASEGADGHTAETLADGGHAEASGMPQLDVGIYPNLIFWLLVSLTALYFVLTRVALPRLREVLAERSDTISNDIEAAARLKRRAEEAERAYNSALAAAKEEAQKIGATTRTQINKELATLMAKADAEIAAKSAESEGRIREIRDSAARSVEEVARATAVEIVRAFLPQHDADPAAIDAAVAERLRG